jgi:ankyrin repeat protein
LQAAIELLQEDSSLIKVLFLLHMLQTAAPAAPAAAPEQASMEELAAILLLRPHTTCNSQGWNALHYAAAARNMELVQQLLDVGADFAAADKQYGLTPLHLACMGRVKSSEQLGELEKARQSLPTLQVATCSMLSPCRSAYSLCVA